MMMMKLKITRVKISFIQYLQRVHVCINDDDNDDDDDDDDDDDCMFYPIFSACAFKMRR